MLKKKKQLEKRKLVFINYVNKKKEKKEKKRT